MTTPAQRIQRLLDEGAKITAIVPGQLSIDITSDVIATLYQTTNNPKSLDKSRNLLKGNGLGRDVPTLVEFT